MAKEAGGEPPVLQAVFAEPGLCGHVGHVRRRRGFRHLGTPA